MQANSKTFDRSVSEPVGQTQSNVNQENGNMKRVPRPNDHVQLRIKHDHLPKKNFARQISLLAEEKIDELEEDAQRVSDTLQDSNFMRITSICEDEPIKNDIVISSIAPPAIIETHLPSHRDIKAGSQWFRWNLLFNLLVWLIVPLPFWIPFVSNRVAYYMIPSIQGVFVSMWTSECALPPFFRLLSPSFSYCYIGFQKCLYCVSKSLS
jgi:hypothetical protein